MNDKELQINFHKLRERVTRLEKALSQERRCYHAMKQRDMDDFKKNRSHGMADAKEKKKVWFGRLFG